MCCTIQLFFYFREPPVSHYSWSVYCWHWYNICVITMDHALYDKIPRCTEKMQRSNFGGIVCLNFNTIWKGAIITFFCRNWLCKIPGLRYKHPYYTNTNILQMALRSFSSFMNVYSRSQLFKSISRNLSYHQNVARATR